MSVTETNRTICKCCGGQLATGLMAGRCLACTVGFTFQDGEELPLPGSREFGGYDLAEEIGRGGMGVVYRATQARLKRTVAVKLLLGGAFATQEATRRFRQEAELAASLHHPGIVPIFEAGESDGQAFYAMEFVEGRSLAELSRGNPLMPLVAARYLQAVAAAVHYAHGQGVLHRDLKPSNILIDAFDYPRITDFGLARPLDEISDLTKTADALGSPPYMAPEQALGKAAVVGVPADVYSLGAVLYHLLTGRPPFQGSSAAQILSQVERDAPLRPSRLHPNIPADIENICLKCLEKSPHQRYASAGALAKDLEHFLRGEIVSARSLSWMTRSWRWAKRNPALAVSSSIAACSIVGGTGVVIYQAIENHAHQLENVRLDTSLRTSLYATDIFAAWQSIHAGDLKAARNWLEPHRQDPRRGLEWAWLWRVSEPQFSREIGRHQGYVQRIACTPDGKWLVSTGFDNHTNLWDLASATKLPVASRPYYAVSPQFLPGKESTELHLIKGRQVTALNLADGTEHPSPSAPSAGQISYSADGKLAAVGDSMPLFFNRRDGAVVLYDATSWTRLWNLPKQAVAVTLSPDGRQLATSSRGGGVNLWDVSAKSLQCEISAPEVCALEFSPDSSILAAGGQGKAWLQQSDGPVVELPHPEGHTVTDVAFAPDGVLLATSCTDRWIRLWRVPDGALLQSLWGHDREVWTVCFRPAPLEILSGSKDGSVLAWEINRTAPTSKMIPADSYQYPIFTAEGSEVLAGHDKRGEHSASLIHCRDGKILTQFPKHRLPLGIGGKQTLILRNLQTSEIEWWSREGALLRKVGVPRADRHIYETAIAPNEATAAVFTRDGSLHLCPLNDAAVPPRILRIPAPTSPPLALRCLRWSPDSQWLAMGFENRPYSAWLVEVATGRLIELPGQLDLVSGLSFSPDSRTLATGTSEGSILIWDVPHGKFVTKLPGHARSVSDVCFTPDGRTLLSLGYPSEVKCWHTGLWRELATFPLTGQGFHLAVSPNQEWLAITKGSNGTTEHVELWPLE